MSDIRQTFVNLTDIDFVNRILNLFNTYVICFQRCPLIVYLTNYTIDFQLHTTIGHYMAFMTMKPKISDSSLQFFHMFSEKHSFTINSCDFQKY